ncbi:peptide deformylase [Tatlockia micdadei]|uniref:peptide deformylase n=1 Tax=Legionella micdadei TaxID=451 RepID=UPI00156F990B|nr:peptide deformylase [Legionella micdadei]NSL18135.1 peptide deformylase [Legionella micdadei]
MKLFSLLLLGLMMTAQQTHALKIVTTDDSDKAQILRKPAHKIHFPLSKEDVELIAAMKQKLYDLKGVGLAALQINYSKQIIAIYIPEESAILRNNAKPYPMHILINPSYDGVEAAGINPDFEACYSVSNKAGKVPRYNQISLHFYDEHGKKHNTIENGFYARVLQHEIDHINGILILDRLTPDCIQGSIEEMMALRRKEFSPQQREIFDNLMKEKEIKSKQ